MEDKGEHKGASVRSTTIKFHNTKIKLKDSTSLNKAQGLGGYVHI